MADTLAQEKRDLRSAMTAHRARVAAMADASAQANAHLLALLVQRHGPDLPGETLAGYMAMRGEIDPRATMADHAGPVCVPVVTGAGQPLEFHRWTPDCAMVEGAFKALIPAQSDPLRPTTLIVPLLAFDRQGYRLGYGGGFYDRTLEMLRAQAPVLAIGFAFGAQLCEHIPREDTDQPLDAVVTPEGVIWPK